MVEDGLMINKIDRIKELVMNLALKFQILNTTNYLMNL